MRYLVAALLAQEPAAEALRDRRKLSAAPSADSPPSA
jgi:hypothetical protein